MPVAEVEIVQLYAREDKSAAKRNAARPNAWVLTGEDPVEIVTGNSGAPRHFNSPGAAVSWLHDEMRAYNHDNPKTPAGYDVHFPTGEVRILRPGKPIVIRPGNAAPPRRSNHRERKVDATPPARQVKKFGPHEWTQLKTPVYIREGYVLYECGLCGMRVRTAEKETNPGIPGTCPRNIIEGE